MFDTEELKTYIGKNPYIKKIKLRLESDNLFKLSDFDDKYLSQNFKYCGQPFSLNLKVGEKSGKWIGEQFNINKEIKDIKIDYLFGETSDVYHFGFKGHNFFSYKDDTENPFAVHLNNLDYDIFKYNLQIKNFDLLPHQIHGIKFMLDNPYSFNCDDMGLGKTVCSVITAIESGAKKTLIVALATIKINWRREVENLGKTAKIISSSVWDDTPTDFTIINYEILKNFVKLKKTDKVKDRILLENFDCIIVDEAHRVKHPKAIQSQCLTKICSSPSVQRVHALTGTPIENNEDYYNICRTLNFNVSDIVLNRGYWEDLKDNYEEYVMRYCNAFELKIDSKKSKERKADLEIVLKDIDPNMVKHKQIRKILNYLDQYSDFKKGIWSTGLKRGIVHLVKPIVGQSNTITMDDLNTIASLDFNDKRKKILVLGRKVNGEMVKNTNTLELHQRIKHTLIRRTKNDVLEYFPNKFISPLYCEFTIKEMKEYDRMWKEYLEEKGGVVDFELLKEFSSSIKVREFLALLKAPHTTNFIKTKIEDGYKCIIFTHFKNEFDYFVEHLGENVVNIHASMSAEKKQQVIDKFQSDPNIMGIIGNIKTLGTGTNLTKATIVAINSPDWNSGEHEQAEDRAYRIGQNEDVNVFYMIFEKTHEEEVYNRSVNKKQNKNVFLGLK